MRLYYDIEVSPNIGLFWQTGHKISVGYESIIKERAIICIAYKWEGQKKVYSLHWDNKQCDKKMLKEFAKVLNSADEVVGHNVDNFDTKWIRTRCLKHGISITPYITSIDTLKEAKKLFRFNSNRLDYISKFLGNSGKTSTGYDLWKGILLDKSKKDLDEMIRYCKNDVVILESVYNAMKPYVKSKSNRGDSIRNCPECNSDNVYVVRYRVSAAGSKSVQYQCQSCGRYHQVPINKFNK